MIQAVIGLARTLRSAGALAPRISAGLDYRLVCYMLKYSMEVNNEEKSVKDVQERGGEKYSRLEIIKKIRKSMIGRLIRQLIKLPTNLPTEDAIKSTARVPFSKAMGT